MKRKIMFLFIFYLITFPLFGENSYDTKTIEYFSFRFNIPNRLEGVINEHGEPIYIYMNIQQ